MSIRKKLVLLMLCIGLVPTLLATSVAYLTINNELTQKTTEQLLGIATKQEQKINSTLQKRQEEVIKLSLKYEFRDAVGRYLATKDKAESEKVVAMFRARKQEVSSIQTAYLLDASGKVLISNTASAVGKQLDARYHARSTGGQQGITLQEDPTDHLHKLYVAYGIILNGQTVKLVVAFSTDEFVGTVQDYAGLGKSGETVIAAQEGKKTFALFPLRFEPDAALKTDLTSLQLSTSGNQAYHQTDYRGQKVLIVRRSLQFANWTMATKIDLSEALSPIAQLRNVLLFILVTSSVAIVFIAFYLARYFTRPIITLTEKTRHIMQGDFTQRISVKSSDEVGALATAFNKMSSELAASYQALEHKVEERTIALKQKMQELKNAHAKDDAILSSIGDGLIVTDAQGRILLINAIAADLLGWDRQKIIGNDIGAYETFDEAGTPLPKGEQPMQVALKTGEKVNRYIKSSTKKVLNVTASPVLQHRRTVGAIQIIRDSTREKEIDRMKTEFISIASHQLRTPLSAIRWFVEMLLSGDTGKLKPEQQEFAQNIEDSTERMIELVNSLLNISRIESGRIIIDPKPTDLHELVSGIINDLKGKTAEKKQTLVISIHKDLPLINLDQRLIGQVYLNLLTNAIKYTPKGGEISVFVSRKGGEIISQVTDNGYGIPKSEQGKMFQKFFRASNIAKVETDGTGLGMYLIKSVVETSGGKIWFESEEGKGSTFWFSLPARGMKAKAGEVSLD